MTSTELVRRLTAVATEYNTLYVMGCFGAPMTATNKQRYLAHHAYNRRAERAKMINAASADTFGFDCVCLIKGILWGWNGDAGKIYGGAVYGANNIPDIPVDEMINRCSDLSTDFTDIVPGEAVWMRGHIGIYIGDGLAVECTPAWKNGVQITACNCSKSGYNRRNWTKHGKLPYISYPEAETDCELTLPILRRGMTGAAVRTLQAILVGKCGISCGSSGVDGSFGPATENAVRTLQKKSGLTQDGIAGKAVWEKLLE